MESGNGSLADIAGLVEAAGVAWVRATLSNEGGQHTVRYLDAVVGAEPPGWAEQMWTYPSVIFVAGQLPGEALAKALLDPTTPITLGGHSLLLPELQSEYQSWSWHPSRARRATGRLPWPATEWTLSKTGGHDSTQWYRHGFLVGAGCPTFNDFQWAHHAFYTGSFAVTGAASPPTHAATITVAHRDGYLHRVRVSGTQTQLDVEVDGTDVSGTEVQLVGACGVITDRVAATGAAALTIPGGLPNDAWLFLVRGSRCLDYRVVGSPFAWGDDITKQGVEFELPDDPESEIAWLVSQGEGPQLEYKVKLPDSDKEKRGVIKTVTAMVTGDGGSIIFGVDPDEMTVVGLDGEQPLSDQDRVMHRDRLTQLARDRVTPTPSVSARWYEHDGKRLLVVDVRAGNEPLYAALESGSPRYYVRHGSNDYPARPEEVQAAVIRHQPAEALTFLSPARKYGLQ